MGIDVKIKDGTGKGLLAKVDSNHAVLTTGSGVPPQDLNTVLKPFATYLTNSAGSNDMRVDGSTTPQDFYIEAPINSHRFVHTLAFTIADAAASLNQFGNLSPLTNGCDVLYSDSRLGDVYIGQELKTNFDFIQMCNFEPMFGTGTSAFLASNVVGSSEAYIPILDIEDVFGMPHGIKLGKGSQLRLTVRINDNLAPASVDRFDVKAYGFDLIELGEK